MFNLADYLLRRKII